MAGYRISGRRSAPAVVGRIPDIRRLFLYVLVGLTAWYLLRHSGAPASCHAGPDGLLCSTLAVAMGLLSVLLYLTMGTIRETSRRPDTVSGKISIEDERRPQAQFEGACADGCGTAAHFDALWPAGDRGRRIDPCPVRDLHRRFVIDRGGHGNHRKYPTNNSRFERLARLIAFTLIFTTAGVSFLGVTLVLTGEHILARFWSILFHIMFLAAAARGIFFSRGSRVRLCLVLLLGLVERATGRKRWHLVFGWAAAASSLIAMLMIDIVASYMLTPRPPDDTWGKLFNPTMIYLDTHRIVGNLTWTGFGLAALSAEGSFGLTEEDRTFYRWAGGVCFTIGFGALLIMPAIGYQYLLRIRHVEPQAFYTLMLGSRSWLLIWRPCCTRCCSCSAPCTSGAACGRARREETARLVLPVFLLVVTAAGIVFSLPYHLQHIPGLHVVTDRVINPLGKMQPNKYFAITFWSCSGC